MSDFYRIKRLPPYVFEQVNRLKAQARAGGADIIDLGMGNPDLAAPKHVIDKLVETAGRPRTDRYSASKGIAGLRRAQANYMKNVLTCVLIPTRRLLRRWDQKRALQIWRKPLLRRATSFLFPTRPIQSMLLVF